MAFGTGYKNILKYISFTTDKGLTFRVNAILVNSTENSYKCEIALKKGIDFGSRTSLIISATAYFIEQRYNVDVDGTETLHREYERESAIGVNSQVQSGNKEILECGWAESSGHEWYPLTIEIDVIKPERISKTERISGVVQTTSYALNTGETISGASATKTLKAYKGTLPKISRIYYNTNGTFKTTYYDRYDFGGGKVEDYYVSDNTYTTTDSSSTSNLNVTYSSGNNGDRLTNESQDTITINANDPSIGISAKLTINVLKVKALNIYGDSGKSVAYRQVDLHTGDNYQWNSQVHYNVLTYTDNSKEDIDDSYISAISPQNGATLLSAGTKEASVKLNNSNLTFTFQYNVITINIEEIEYGITDAISVTGYTIAEIGTKPFYIVPQSKIANGTMTPSDAIGYVTLGIDREDASINAKVVLFKNADGDYDIDNPSMGVNCIVQFPHKTDGYADKINKMTFGQIYNNQLFVCGNPSIANIDYHTESNSEDEEDLTYFSDLNYCKYGSENSKVVGYDVFSDGDLIVFKEESKHEPTIYYRNINYVTATNSSGEIVKGNEGETFREEMYPRFVLNQSGEGAISRHLIINYLGDTIVGTINGLKILNTKSVSSNQHTNLVDISTLINPKLLKEDYENAKLFTFEKRMFITTSRGLYIVERGLNESYRYEYFFEDVQASEIFDYKHEIYFVDKISHKLCKVARNGSNAPRIDYIYVKPSILDASSGANIRLSEDYALISNESWQLVNENDELIADVYLTENASSYSNGVRVSMQFYDLLVSHRNNNDEMPLFDVANSSALGGYSLREDDSDLGDIKYLIVFNNGAQPTKIGYKSVKKIFIERKSEVGKLILKDSDDTELRNIWVRNALIKGLFRENRMIAAVYETKPFSFGNVLYQKTLKTYTVANDVALNSSISVYIQASNKYSAFNYASNSAFNYASSGSSQMSGNLENFNVNKIQFDYDVLPHLYTKVLNIPRINYAKFIFTNNGSYNAVLSQLSMSYLSNQSNAKGVK